MITENWPQYIYIFSGCHTAEEHDLGVMIELFGEREGIALERLAIVPLASVDRRAAEDLHPLGSDAPVRRHEPESRRDHEGVLEAAEMHGVGDLPAKVQRAQEREGDRNRDALFGSIELRRVGLCARRQQLPRSLAAGIRR